MKNKKDENNQMELATQETTALTSPMTTELGRGFESGIDQDDFKMSRAILLQKMSPQVDADHPAGSIIDSETGELIGDMFTPIGYYKEYIKFNARDRGADNFIPGHEPGAVIWKTKDKSDPRVIAECHWGANNEKPTATTFFNFLVLFEGQRLPMVVGFAKTSYKAGEKLFNIIVRKGGDSFSHTYELFSDEKSSDFGAYFVFDVVPHAKTEGDFFAVAEAAWQKFSGKMDRVQADVSDAE